MTLRNFIKRGALFVPMILVPKVIRAQTVLTADGLVSFKKKISGGGCTPSYANTGGTGDRRSIITTTTTARLNGSVALPTTWIDGATASDPNGTSWWATQDQTGKTLTWDFQTGHSANITEIKYYQSDASAQATLQVQGSNDGSTWSNIGSTFALGGIATQIITTPSANTTFYRYYQILCVSGSTFNGPFVYEFEFKLCYL